jgi:hypothetical protein
MHPREEELAVRALLEQPALAQRVGQRFQGAQDGLARERRAGRSRGAHANARHTSVVSLNWLVFRCAQNGLGQGARKEHPRCGL